MNNILKSKAFLTFILGIAGYFLFMFLSSAIFYISIQNIFRLNYLSSSNLNVLSYAMMIFSILLVALVNYRVLKFKNISINYLYPALFITLLMRYVDFYFGSMLNRLFTNFLYLLKEDWAINTILIAFVFLNFLLGIFFYRIALKLNTTVDPIVKIPSSPDILDEQF